MTIVTHKTIVAFIPALDVEMNARRNPNASIQNEVILVTDNDLLLLDDDEEAEKYDWYNEPPAEDFGNLDINRVVEIDLE